MASLTKIMTVEALNDVVRDLKIAHHFLAETLNSGGFSNNFEEWSARDDRLWYCANRIEGHIAKLRKALRKAGSAA